MERTITMGEYKYLIEEMGWFVRVRILKNGLRHDEKTFPSMEHLDCYLNKTHGVD